MPVMVAGVGPRSRLSAGCVAAQSHKQCLASAATSQVLPANRRKREVDPRGLEPLTSAMRGQRDSFPELAKLLQTTAFLRWRFSQPFRRFTRVAARLLHRR